MCQWTKVKSVVSVVKLRHYFVSLLWLFCNFLHPFIVIFTSAKEVMFLPVFVCLFVCESTRWLEKLWTDLSEILRVRRAWHKLPVIQFWRDPAGILDSGSLGNFRYHCVKGGIREPLAKRRWWRHLANSFALAEVPLGYDCFLVL